MQSQSLLEDDESNTINQKPAPIQGLHGKYSWQIRISSAILFALMIVVNYVFGLKTGSVSAKYRLYITPPGLFFSIWAVIYTTLGIITVYNLIKNQWNLGTHIWFAVSDVLNMAWIVVFGVATDVAVDVSFLILLMQAVSILLIWVNMGKITKQTITFWFYFYRNVVAFYAGWCIAATNLNLGIVLVFWWGLTKETQLIVFWVVAPLSAIAVTALNVKREGTVGALSCFALWISVIWGFVGLGYGLLSVWGIS